MRLLQNLIELRINLAKDLELNHQELRSLWHHYQIYILSMNFLGIEGEQIKDKNKLIKELILNPDNRILLNKVKNLLYKESIVVDSVLDRLEFDEENYDHLEEFYPNHIFAVDLNERQI